MDEKELTNQAVETASVAMMVLREQQKSNRRKDLYNLIATAVMCAAICFCCWQSYNFMSMYDYAAESTSITADQDGSGINIVTGGDVNGSASNGN